MTVNLEVPFTELPEEQRVAVVFDASTGLEPPLTGTEASAIEGLLLGRAPDEASEVDIRYEIITVPTRETSKLEPPSDRAMSLFILYRGLQLARFTPELARHNLR